MGVKLQSSSGGSVEIAAPVTASNYTLTAPATNGTILNDVSSLAAANLAGNVDVARLVSAFSGSNVSLAGSGYQKLPSGLIIQWGAYNQASNSTLSVSVPIAFPNSFWHVFPVHKNDNVCTVYYSYPISNTQFSTRISGGAGTEDMGYFAIGY